jgi:hypothetical protein
VAWGAKTTLIAQTVEATGPDARGRHGPFRDSANGNYYYLRQSAALDLQVWKSSTLKGTYTQAGSTKTLITGTDTYAVAWDYGTNEFLIIGAVYGSAMGFPLTNTAYRFITSSDSWAANVTLDNGVDGGGATTVGIQVGYDEGANDPYFLLHEVADRVMGADYQRSQVARWDGTNWQTTSANPDTALEDQISPAAVWSGSTAVYAEVTDLGGTYSDAFEVDNDTASSNLESTNNFGFTTHQRHLGAVFDSLSWVSAHNTSEQIKKRTMADPPGAPANETAFGAYTDLNVDGFSLQVFDSKLWAAGQRLGGDIVFDNRAVSGSWGNEGVVASGETSAERWTINLIEVDADDDGTLDTLWVVWYDGTNIVYSEWSDVNVEAGVGSADGDSIASGEALLEGTGIGTADGDSEASGELTQLHHTLGSGEGDSEASGADVRTTTEVSSAEGDSEASGVVARKTMIAGSAEGDSEASGVSEVKATAQGSAEGDSAASGDDTLTSFIAGSAQGDSEAQGEDFVLPEHGKRIVGDAIDGATFYGEDSQQASQNGPFRYQGKSYVVNSWNGYGVYRFTDNETLTEVVDLATGLADALSLDSTTTTQSQDGRYLYIAYPGTTFLSLLVIDLATETLVAEDTSALPILTSAFSANFYTHQVIELDDEVIVSAKSADEDVAATDYRRVSIAVFDKATETFGSNIELLSGNAEHYDNGRLIRLDGIHAALLFAEGRNTINAMLYTAGGTLGTTRLTFGTTINYGGTANYHIGFPSSPHPTTGQVLVSWLDDTGSDLLNWSWLEYDTGEASDILETAGGTISGTTNQGTSQVGGNAMLLEDGRFALWFLRGEPGEEALGDPSSPWIVFETAVGSKVWGQEQRAYHDQAGNNLRQIYGGNPTDNVIEVIVSDAIDYAAASRRIQISLAHVSRGSAEGDSEASGVASQTHATAGSAEGDSEASGVALCIAPILGSAEGDSEASGVDVRTTAGVGSAEGDSEASGSLAGKGVGIGSAEGDSEAAGLPTATTLQAGSSEGDSEASGVPLGIAGAAGSAEGDSEASGIPALTLLASGSAEGDSEAAGVVTEQEPVVGSFEGDSEASGVAVRTTEASGSAEGDSEASGAAVGTSGISGSAQGDSEASGEHTALLVGSAEGDSEASGDDTLITFPRGSAEGDSEASADNTLTTFPLGSADGDSEASGDDTLTAFIAGSAEGDSEAAGVATEQDLIVGSAEGDSEASGVAFQTHAAAGSAEGDSEGSGVAVGTSGIAGSAEGDSQASGEPTALLVGSSEGDSEASGVPALTLLASASAEGDSEAAGVDVRTSFIEGTADGDSEAAGVATEGDLIVGSAEGDSIASGVAFQTHATAGSAEGDSEASGLDVRTAALLGTAEGDSEASGVAVGTSTLEGSAEGGSEASGVAENITFTEGSAEGDSEAAGVAAATSGQAGSAAGDSEASGIALNTTFPLGSGEGDSEASGGATVISFLVGSAEGDSEAAGIAGDGNLIVGSASGDSEASGVATLTTFPLGSAEGDSSASGVDVRTTGTPGSGEGDSEASGEPGLILYVVGSAEGDSAASGIPVEAVTEGSAEGDSEASGVATLSGTGIGSGEGDSEASGVATLSSFIEGSAEGDSSASGVMAALCLITGSAEGDSGASGIPLTVLPQYHPGIGSAYGDSAASAVPARFQVPSFIKADISVGPLIGSQETIQPLVGGTVRIYEGEED